MAMIRIVCACPQPAGAANGPYPDHADEVKAMAKGQMRSNKEVKKPKKDKAKPAIAVASTASRLQGAQDKAKGDK